MTDKVCSKCGQEMSLDATNGMFICPNGHKRMETLDEASERIRAQGQRPAIALTFSGKVDARARSLFESAQDYLWRGDQAAALDALYDAVDIQPEFSDAHLWIARTTPDPKLKREHLERLLAYDPGNLEGIRELMILDGRLSPEEAERSRKSDTPMIRSVDQVRAQTQTLICPVCGGALTVDEASNRVVCKFCGHTETLKARSQSDEGITTLGEALIERRAKGVTWVIGDRLLHCSQCGSDRTIPQGRLSGECPFCGSKAVIVQDVANSFEQPNSLIPFIVDEEAAKLAVRERLRTLDERLYALRGENKTTSAIFEGCYVPFWVFDALIDVSQTITDRRMPQTRDEVRTFQAYQNVHFPDGVMGICVPAVKSPPPTLLQQVAEFSLDHAEAYDPRRLAKYPAVLYSIDVDKASLTARSVASAQMRARHARSETVQVEINVFALVKQMTFSLMLMPIWLGQLFERDGDMRTVLVNGQNGRVALGAAQKERG